MKKPRFRGRLTDYYKRKLWEYLLFHTKKFTPENRRRVRKAYNLAFVAHREQRRKGGDKAPYITHPVEVAIIASKEMGFGTTTIIAALLHDVVEDNPNYSLEYVREKFGKQIATIVDGVTKITVLNETESSVQMDTFINMVLTIPKDYRVFIIKIADRLHNMRTMSDMLDNTRRIKSSENLFLYARIAEMVGLWKIKNEIENRSFQYLHSDSYNKILTLRDIEDEKIQSYLTKFQTSLTTVLLEAKSEIEAKLEIEAKTKIDLKFEIQTIERSLFSVWKKMNKKNLKYKDVHNHYSTRIIFDIPHKMNRHSAYPIYFAITDRIKEQNKSIRDWIINPKRNGFRALVFDVMFEGHWQEIQIISKDDNEIAHSGFLKKSKNIIPGFHNLENAIKKDLNKEEDSIEIIDRIQEIINLDNIFVFTPNGESIEMPKNSTILDFAFRIHTNLGFKCIGAKINDNQAVKSPRHLLETTQKIEILTSENIEPKIEWLDIVQTSRAKKAIISYFNKLNEDNVIEEKAHSFDFSYRKPFVIDDSIEFTVAQCCNPIIGENAMAHLNRENKINVHKESCHRAIELRAKYSKSTTTVQWERINKNDAILATIEFEGEDKVGVLKSIIDFISEELNINMKKILVENFDGFFKGHIELYISNFELLNKIISKIKDLEGLKRVARIDNKFKVDDDNIDLLFSH
jgi:GTP diphosphokinase / guanosine-3',5'-bis(diphosphate) 3'-diphosphatase